MQQQRTVNVQQRISFDSYVSFQGTKTLNYELYFILKKLTS